MEPLNLYFPKKQKPQPKKKPRKKKRKSMQALYDINSGIAPMNAASSHPIEHRFNPYSNHGGTIMAIAGEDYCIMASDTRQSEGYSINTRISPKMFQLNEHVVLASSGFNGDILALNKNLKVKMELYRYQHSKEMSCPAAAQMLSTVLYSKRFFPYYAFNILGGLDPQGRGAVYHFDVVGSFQREYYRADGTAQALIQPFLDNQVGFKNQYGVERRLLSREEALKLIRDAFTAATERDIHTGDYLDVFTITSGGVDQQRFDLKKD